MNYVEEEETVLNDLLLLCVCKREKATAKIKKKVLGKTLATSERAKAIKTKLLKINYLFSSMFHFDTIFLYTFFLQHTHFPKVF